MTNLVRAVPNLPALPDLEQYARAAKAESTRLAYGQDWRGFEAWCAAHGLPSMPTTADSAARYVVALGQAGKSVRWIGRVVAAIADAHVVAGYDPPPTTSQQFRQVLAGVVRTHGKAANRKDALTGPDFRRLIELTPNDTPPGLRDRALLLLGHHGAFRRSEVVALDVADITPAPEGLRVTLRRSKTDQKGSGVEKPIARLPEPMCAVSALQRWRAAAGITAGPLFRPIDRHGNVRSQRLSGHSVAAIVKAACVRAGLDPTLYSGHSLRAGFATGSAKGGAESWKIREQTGHVSDRMLAGYIRAGRAFEDSALGYIDFGFGESES